MDFLDLLDFLSNSTELNVTSGVSWHSWWIPLNSFQTRKFLSLYSQDRNQRLWNKRSVNFTSRHFTRILKKTKPSRPGCSLGTQKIPKVSKFQMKEMTENAIKSKWWPRLHVQPPVPGLDPSYLSSRLCTWWTYCVVFFSKGVQYKGCCGGPYWSSATCTGA